MSRNEPVERERVPEPRAARRLIQAAECTTSRSPRGHDRGTRAHAARHGLAEAASPCFGPVSPLGHASQKAISDDQARINSADRIPAAMKAAPQDPMVSRMAEPPVS